MKKILIGLLWVFPLCSLFSQSNLKRIDSLLRFTYHNDEPGASVAILKKGKLVFQKAYGLSDMQTKELNKISSNFNIGSLTKQFTAFGILQLAAKNKLSLSDKLIRFFPDFNPHIGNEVTIQELLTHSSGIIDHYAFVDTNKIKHATDKDVLDAVKHIDSTYFVPGTQFRYSNTAYCLLAIIIEKRSGLSYADYIKKNIFEPLSMNHSQVLQIGRPINQDALGYDTLDGHFKKLDAAESIFFSTEGDGGIYTSTGDYLKWFRSLQSGKLLNRKWVEETRSAQFPVNRANQLSYGYGWFINEKYDDKAVYHTGSNGGFRSIAFSIPSKNYLLVIFSNRTGIELENLVEEINKILRVTGKTYTKVDPLESFNNSSLIFAPCKEII